MHMGISFPVRRGISRPYVYCTGAATRKRAKERQAAQEIVPEMTGKTQNVDKAVESVDIVQNAGGQKDRRTGNTVRRPDEKRRWRMEDGGLCSRMVGALEIEFLSGLLRLDKRLFQFVQRLLGAENRVKQVQIFFRQLGHS